MVYLSFANLTANLKWHRDSQIFAGIMMASVAYIL
jgi:hypothetical protein